MDMDIVERNKQVKQILSQEFGVKNVSVKNGRGSAWGWCYIKIKVTDPCPYQQNESPCAQYCGQVCQGNNMPLTGGGWRNSARQIKHTEVTSIAKNLIRSIPFYTYQDDMGDEHKEYILSIDFV